MSGFCRFRCLFLAIPLVLMFTFACTRPTPDVPGEGATQGNSTPFQSQETSTADNGTQFLSPVHALSPEPPFQDSQTIPAGTLIIVTLKAPLVAGGASQPFDAVLDEPVVVDGTPLIPRDAPVSGLIQSAHISKSTPQRDYLRLALSSVEIDGLSVPIQTASLFARRQPLRDADSGTIRLEKGRRLTFRLNEPVFLHPNTSKVNQ